MYNSNFDKFPEVVVHGYNGCEGWTEIISELTEKVQSKKLEKQVIVFESYQGVLITPIVEKLKAAFPKARFFDVTEALLPKDELDKLLYPFVTDDPVFGYMTSLTLNDFFRSGSLESLGKQIDDATDELTFIVGTGASLVPVKCDLLIYADMPRWEIQLRFRRNEVGNIGADNATDTFAYQYKRAFFVDWRVCDKLKRNLLDRSDYILDTTNPELPKMVTGAALMDALEKVANRPFRVVPFFDPGPWGGQWLKEVCDLKKDEKNFAWGFDCVPEENSLLIRFDHILFETPSINLVFYQPKQLLGPKVYEAFGAEFPIRFDFLDTMEGGNLSLQVHPTTQYIRDTFGMNYTQDESYYMLDAKEDATVFLGLKTGIDTDEMIADLHHAQDTGGKFDAEKYVNVFPAKKHDHFLIPNGTIHCSGVNGMVLEISATPYIFTFKLYDWGRLGLDGEPRAINIEHGSKVINRSRDTEYCLEQLVNRIDLISEGDGWREERTGLHKNEFIETRRHWFSKKVLHQTNDSVNVLNLVEGVEAIVESPENAFEPFVVHYAETFIVPAAVGEYTIRPFGESEGKQCATIKAYVRHKA